MSSSSDTAPHAAAAPSPLSPWSEEHERVRAQVSEYRENLMKLAERVLAQDPRRQSELMQAIDAIAGGRTIEELQKAERLIQWLHAHPFEGALGREAAAQGNRP